MVKNILVGLLAKDEELLDAFQPIQPADRGRGKGNAGNGRGGPVRAFGRREPDGKPGHRSGDTHKPEQV